MITLEKQAYANRITLRLPRALALKLDELAMHRSITSGSNISRTMIVREALAQWIYRQDNLQNSGEGYVDTTAW